jgi:hypothetical protein
LIALCLSLLICASTSSVLLAQQGAVTPEIINSLSAPAKADTRIGALEFKDGMPTAATVEKAYDYLDFEKRVRVRSPSWLRWRRELVFAGRSS